MSRELLQKVIDKGVEGYLNEFFVDVSKYYTEMEGDLSQYDGNGFSDFQAIGEINFSPGEKLVVVTANIAGDLTERSGKKAQYEKAKKILKRYMRYDAGIFVFSDLAGSFRLSLVYGTPDAARLVWSNFRRFTYFVSKSLTNKTFLDRVGICTFTSLDVIKDAFSVEKVNKLFYSQIADWYFWAGKEVTFPKEAEAEPEGRKISVIRLITRLIFIWFMKERGLVSPGFFDKQKAASLLKSLQDGETTYYKAILQNLFFATLNTKIEDRKFRFKPAFQGKNDDYMDHTIYRYETYFKNQDTMLELFKDIPFLNGGLFDCLDRRFVEDGKNAEMRIDGFSDKEVGLSVPNKLFFSDEIEVDLNEDYGTTHKRYRSQGLLNILAAYNFTIDENDPNDQEVALDPELLGKVFENLLASYNPETATTARKATGSYYTPREIVDYMVTESLKQYFKTHLQDVADIDNKLEDLFSAATDRQSNTFGDADTLRMVTLIDDLRIVDPAVGSGAFPMGILNKLVFILSKVDPDNKLWKETQLKVVDGVPDPIIKQNLKAQITTRFAEKNANYGRKLYLIEKCIYGVDIQQIAIEIAKLRFFIALLVDEKIDKSKYNWGVESLPNLDFKLMQGNSLVSEFMGINLDADNSQSYGRLMKDELDILINEFQSRKSDFQNEADPKKKVQLKKIVENLIIKIFESKLKEQKAGYLNQLKRVEDKYSHFSNASQKTELIAKEVEELNRKSGFDLKAAEKQLRDFTTGFVAKPFFAWKLYFAEVFQEKGGFDVVIANPPYGFRNVLTAQEKQYFRKERGIEFPSGDIAELFIIVGYQKLVRKGGNLTFIIPKKSLYGESWKNVRRTWVSGGLTYLMDASKAFEEVLLEQVSFSICKEKGKKERVAVGALNQAENHVDVFGFFAVEDIFSKDMKNAQIYKGVVPKSILDKVGARSVSNTTGLIKAEIGISNITKDLCFEANGNHPCVKGIDIMRWGLKPEKRYLKGRAAKAFLSQYKGDKVVAQEIVAHIENPCPHILISMFYDDTGRLMNDTCVEIKVLDKRLSKKFLLAWYQSTFCNWYAYNLIYNRAIRTMHFIDYYVTQIPIPKAILDNPEHQNSIIAVVNEILAITKDEDYLSNHAKQAKVKELERQIDEMVYELYGLTGEEIKIIEGET